MGCTAATPVDTFERRSKTIVDNEPLELDACSIATSALSGGLGGAGVTRMTVLGAADARNDIRNGWQALLESADTVTADGAFVSLVSDDGKNLKDWPLGDPADLDLEALDE